MTDRFQIALTFTLAWEGGYVNDPDDPGGATNKGITQKTYDVWRQKHEQPINPVLHIADDEVAAIYKQNYWNPVSLTLPEPLDIAAFDTGVNCGVARCLGWIAADYVGTETGPSQRVVLLLHRRLAHYDRLVAARPAMSKFMKGWHLRVTALGNLLQVIL